MIIKKKNIKKNLGVSELSLKEKLMEVDHEKLVDILISLHVSSTDVQKQMDIIFAGLDENPKKMRGMIKKEISALKRSTRFVDYYEADVLALRLDALRIRIANDLRAKSQKEAFEIMLEFLNIHKNTLNRSDDSNGSIGAVFIEACRDFGMIAQSCDHLTLLETVEVIYSLFMDNPFGIYDEIIANFKSVLTSEGLDLLQSIIEQSSSSGFTDTIKIKCGLTAIADSKNDVDAFIKACSFRSKLTAHDHLDIAQRLIKHWRGKEAIKWLSNIELPANHLLQQNKKELLIEALESEGEYDKAQNERLLWFEETLNPKLYRQILRSVKSDFKESFKLEAVEKAFQYNEPHKALEFLIEAQEFEQAAKLVRERSNQLSGNQYYILRPAADIIQKIDKIAATIIYRKLLEPILNETKSKYYKYAAKDLTSCAMLSTKISDWDDLLSHDEYFKDIEFKHKRKVSFWYEYKSALQKRIAKELKVKS